MSNWTERYENKKIVLLGFGREGRSTFDFLKKYVKNCELQIMDRNADYVHEVLKKSGHAVEGVSGEMDRGIEVYSAEDYLKFHSDVDLVFKSPGIPLKQLEGHVDLSIVTSQSNEFIREYRDHIIGITGTKGKSTTCSFLYELLRQSGADVELVGNIGKPAFDHIDMSTEAPMYVYELSSHQLETAAHSPHIAVVLNIFEEHLDHYHSFDHYAEAKMNIGRFQNSEDRFIYDGVEEVIKRLKGFCGRLYPVVHNDDGCYDVEQSGKLEECLCINRDTVMLSFDTMFIDLPYNMKRKLQGRHNLVNMGIGLLIYKMLGYSDYALFRKVVKEFEGLPHRLREVATVDGVTYYNDSISTIPQAAIAAVEAVDNTETVILGGMDRGIDYSSLIDYIIEHPELKCIMLPDTGHKLASEIRVILSTEGSDRRGKNVSSKKNSGMRQVDLEGDVSGIHVVEDLEEAVGMAASVTSEGKACLLSPAAPSYGFFKNFEDRGDQFEKLVRGLMEKA